MAYLRFSTLIFRLSSIILLSLGSFSIATDEDRKVYVVYMGALPSHRDYIPTAHHNNLIHQVLENKVASENFHIRSFKRSFNGFVAKLTKTEKDKLARMDGVVSVFPRINLEIHTTRSWDFMGLTENIKRDKNTESNTIIGVIDTGIWPESDSFNDEGFGLPPAKWKGACNGGKNFTCNNKIIGARYYTSPGLAESDNSARDVDGHGSHTSSIAAGNPVRSTSFFGLANGTARGGVPSARIATYKACGVMKCPNDAILAAFDDAIADGVDVLTVSLGTASSRPFEEDAIAIGAFHAMSNGILTVNSAGNSGPNRKTVSSVAPWMLTVAASSTDRRFIDKVVIGNGKSFTGLSINSFDLNGTMFPLVYGKEVSTNCSWLPERSCYYDCIDSKLVKGKILLCDQFEGIDFPINLGAVGWIVNNTRRPDVSAIVAVPATALADAEYQAVVSYKDSERNPVATILKSETVKDPRAPIVVSFSSRGPNTVVSDILKPDITAPGVNILAAYSPIPAASSFGYETRHVKYSFLSGTSMACPHVAAVAAHLKSAHPQWSPSVIKSAIMTTAWQMNRSANLDGEFAYGSGHVDPIKATDPGLVYETSKEDYISMLCAMNFSGRTIGIISGDNNITCPIGPLKLQVRDINYPSMTAQVTSGEAFNITFHRTVTNVGMANSTYTARVIGDPELSISVVPQSLFFSSLNEKRSFTVAVSGKSLADFNPVSASLVWSDGTHTVRSPIVVYSA